MRAAAVWVTVFLLASGCLVQPPDHRRVPGAPSTGPSDEPRETSEQPGVGGFGPADPPGAEPRFPWRENCTRPLAVVWREPGIRARLEGAPPNSEYQPFDQAPSGGLAVTEPRAVERYGPANVTTVKRVGPGASGALVAIRLDFLGTQGGEPKGAVVGEFEGADPSAIRAEYLEFARLFRNASESTLGEEADDFADEAQQINASTRHRIELGGSFSTDALVAWLSEEGGNDSRNAYPGGGIVPRTVTLGRGNLHANLSVASLGWNRPFAYPWSYSPANPDFAVSSMRGDWVGLVVSAGYKGPQIPSLAWRFANETFARMNWPAPNLVQATFWWGACDCKWEVSGSAMWEQTGLYALALDTSAPDGWAVRNEAAAPGFAFDWGTPQGAVRGNFLYVMRNDTGVSGKLLQIQARMSPSPHVEGYFNYGVTYEEAYQEYIAFAARAFESDENLTRYEAHQFGAAMRPVDGQWMVTTLETDRRPRVPALLDELGSGSGLARPGPSSLWLTNGAWSAAVAFPYRGFHRAGAQSVEVGLMDGVGFRAWGLNEPDDEAALMARANETFDLLGWPRADVSPAWTHWDKQCVRPPPRHWY